MFRNKPRILFLTIATFMFVDSAISSGQQEVVVGAKGQVAGIENSFVKIDYDLSRGTYGAVDKRNNSVCISEAVTSIGVLNSSDSGFTHAWQSEPAKDALGIGKTLKITSSKPGLPSIILEITLSCRNNLLVTFGNAGARKSLVIGGLTYNDFEKFAKASKNSKGAPAAAQNFLRIDVWSDDPVGKLVDPGTRYVPNDKYFVNFAEDNPFAALEEYRFALRAAQAIKLNVYDFPSVCLWYVSVEEHGGGPAINDSTGAVWEEIEQAAKRGFSREAGSLSSRSGQARPR